jgi:hypothetical protein
MNSKYTFEYQAQGALIRVLDPLTGVEAEIPVDKSDCCDPSTETYHSM